MNEQSPAFQPRVSSRLRLTLSYALFLVGAGVFAMFGAYLLMLYVPTFPITAENPEDASVYIGLIGTRTRQEVLEAVVVAGGVILAILLVIGIIGGWVLTGWVLRPLRNINDAAQTAAAGRLDHRINLSGRNDEFRQLADNFDRMLDQLNAAFEAQERFAANASHELRTPLAITETMLDVARRNPEGQDYPALVERLSITNARAIGLTEALLRLADANPITATSRPLNLADIVRDAVSESAGEADEQDIWLNVRLTDAWMVGDPTLLGQLAANLIQNAIRHNVVGGYAEIAVTHNPRRSILSLRVENTGAIYTPEVAAQLSEPFLRGSGRIRQGGRARRGYGLGLALVSRITDVHHGVLTIVPRPGGGLVTVVTLPVSDQVSRDLGVHANETSLRR